MIGPVGDKIIHRKKDLLCCSLFRHWESKNINPRLVGYTCSNREAPSLLNHVWHWAHFLCFYLPFYVFLLYPSFQLVCLYFSKSIYLVIFYLSICVYQVFSSRTCPYPCVSHLAGAHRAPITVQHPDLPTVLDLVVMDTVAGAVVPVGAPAVIASFQVEAHCVVGTGVPPRLAFINICREHKKWHHAYSLCR